MGESLEGVGRYERIRLNPCYGVIIYEIEEIINKAVDGYGYRVTARTGQLSEEQEKINFHLSVKPDINIEKHKIDNPKKKALESIIRVIPNFNFKGYNIDVTISDSVLKAD